MTAPSGAPLRVLVVATKSPASPVGGGNVALRALLDALPGAGVEVTLVAPEPGRGLGVPRPWAAVVAHLLAGEPASLARFRSPQLAAAVAAAIAATAPDVVHLEQLHLAWLADVPELATGDGAPVFVLRQQNVESRVLARLAPHAAAPLRPLLAREARRLARAEARACAAVGRVAAISAPDAELLRRAAPDARVEVLPAPFAPRGRAAATLAGDPPLLALGSFDWWPTRDGGRWLLREVWPHLRAALPGAVLHLAGPGSAFGGDAGAGVMVHGRVADSRALYDPRAIALVPLRAGSGVRLRILEAWDAGVPVVTTSVGGEGLTTGESEGALVADDPRGFAATVARLAADAGLRARLVAGGEERLQEYRPATVAARARAFYEAAIERGGATPGARTRFVANAPERAAPRRPRAGVAD